MKRLIASPPTRLRQRLRSDGTWRIWWEPKPDIRRLGFETVELDAERPTWSIREAQRLNAEVEATRKGEDAPKPETFGGRTVRALIGAYKQSPKWVGRLRDETRKDYQNAFLRIEDKWGATMVKRMTRGVVSDWYEALYRETSPAVAVATWRKLSLLMTYAVRKEWIDNNPCIGVEVQALLPRQRIASWEEFDALIKVARDLGLHSMELAIVLAMFQGQRATDIREAMTEHLSDDMWLLVRSKRGNHGGLVLHSEVIPRLQATIERQGETGPLVRHERTGKPYSKDLLVKTFARIRAAASKSLPSVQDLQFRDLRRTFAHNARMGGASERDVGDALGNSAHRDPKISGTYMPQTFDTASRAVASVARPKRGRATH
ncbi:MAG: hypothetical protein AAF968_11825 [Pseudomonadota bacterium]